LIENEQDPGAEPVRAVVAELPAFEDGDSDADDGAGVKLYIRCTHPVVRLLKLQPLFLKRFGVSDWRTGDFVHSFPELARSGKDYRGQSLVEAALNIAKDDERAGEKFEAFGLKVPAVIVHQAGGILVLMVQFYLMLHFWILSKQHEFKPDILEAAWIGTYDNILARICTVTTVSVLPLTTIVMLSWNGLVSVGRDWRDWHLYSSILSVAICALLGLFLILSARRIWTRVRLISGGALDPALETEISMHAYRKWDEAGRPSGDSLTFWLEAEKELKYRGMKTLLKRWLSFWRRGK
jgi:hypothetical protein